MIQRESALNTDQLRDMIQDAHLNFLLGAGASMPLFALLGDVENLLTDIAATDADEDAIAFARASAYAHFFTGVIAKNDDLLRRTASAKKLLATYERFIQTLNRLLLRRRSAILNKQVNLFTTNIDIAVEIAAEDLQAELNDGFTGRFNSRFSTSNFGSVVSRRSLQYDNLSEVPTFNLLKLHGSVSWATRRLDGTDVIAFDRRLGRIAKAAEALEEVNADLPAVDDDTTAEDLLAEGEGHELDLDGFLAAYRRLAIVNPTKDKFQQTVLNQNYYDLLRLFSNEMEKENTLLFVVGFSCRDEHIKELMVRAARVNPTLQIIIFAYDSTAAAQIAAEFKQQPVTNGNIQILEPPGPAEDGTTVVFDLSTITGRFFDPLVPTQSRIAPEALRNDGAASA
jgi:hypothetical protein